ncbi:MAG: hypothetical protein K0B16_09830 [Burkholderiaceae bacterium]|nr:hypothetical protein [Burkholderiaceae bacterium]
MEYALLSGSGSSLTNGIAGWFDSLAGLGDHILQLALDNPAQSAALVLLIAGVGWFLQRR